MEPVSLQELRKKLSFGELLREVESHAKDWNDFINTATNSACQEITRICLRYNRPFWDF